MENRVKPLLGVPNLLIEASSVMNYRETADLERSGWLRLDTEPLRAGTTALQYTSTPM